MVLRNHLNAWILLASVLLVSACATTEIPVGAGSGVTVLDQTNTLPAPTAADYQSSIRPYLIGPADKLSVTVFGIENLSLEEVQADGNGAISVPLAGTINAAGKSTAEVAREIEAKLRAKFVRNPEVSVNLREAVSQVVTVDGEVDKPGQYPVVGKMTLMRAVAAAGGTGEFAKLEEVIILRTVNDNRYAGVYNLKAIRRGGYDDPEVFANDVISVGDSPARRRFKDIIQLAPLLTTPLLILFQRI
jgi:polysaccharide biosynthesis/export protein